MESAGTSLPPTGRRPREISGRGEVKEPRAGAKGGEESSRNLISGTKLGKVLLCKYLCANDHLFSPCNGGNREC